MKKRLIIAFTLLLPLLSFAGDKAKFGIKFSGFVKTDIFNDSRQTVWVREGHLLLFPKNVSLDANNNDINSKSNFNMLSIQTRLKGAITGPDVLGAKTSGVIEGAFFGHTNADINGFRLRHAFAKLRWENSELLVGQYWHAMFITENFPGVVSFNTGIPFQPFSRNPQVRFTQYAENFKFVFTAMSERDFASTGPLGGTSTYLRNANIPELNFTMHYNANLGEGSKLLLGAGANYLNLLPRLTTDDGYITNERVEGISFMGFAKLTTKDITWKIESVFGQNNNNLLMLGGYAPKLGSSPFDADGDYAYTPSKVSSFWTELHTNGKKWQTGIFLGYTKNNGYKDQIATTSIMYTRGGNIDYVYRVAPRVMYNEGKMRFALELEHTTAAYGTTHTDGTVIDSEEVNNLRVLFAVYYFF